MQATIEAILEESDIVWPVFGSETIEELAAKITDRLEEQGWELPQ